MIVGISWRFERFLTGRVNDQPRQERKTKFPQVQAIRAATDEID